MKNQLLLILCILPIGFAQAQDTIRKRASISVHQGFTHIITKDLYRSPYVYRGLNPSVALTFEKYADKSFHRIHAGLSFGTIKTSFSPLASDNLLNVEYSYLRKLTGNQRFELYAGPQLQALSWRTNYFPDMDVPSYAKVHSYMLGFSAGAAAYMNFKISPRSSIKVFVSSPLLTYADRPHFLDGSQRNLQAGVFNFWNPRVQLMYEYKVSETFSFSIGYHYQYMHYREPKALRMLGNGLSIGLKFKFGKVNQRAKSWSE